MSHSGTPAHATFTEEHVAHTKFHGANLIMRSPVFHKIQTLFTGRVSQMRNVPAFGELALFCYTLHRHRRVDRCVSVLD
jgi:hypothetical protein